MDYFFLFLFSIIFKNIKGFEQIPLLYMSNNFYIPIKINKNEELDHYILSNILPVNIFPSSKCDICENHINEKDNNSYSLIKSGVTTSYYYYNFSGDLYESNITLGKHEYSMKLIAFDTVNYVKKYGGKGRFSLSFLNYNFNTEKKIFGLSLTNSENYFLDLGGYDQSKIEDKSKLKTFNVTKTNYTDELQNMWYINFSYLSINDHKLENKSYKLTFDISTHSFHIPKDFFFENINYIFHEDSKCQVQSDGYFICACDIEYQKKFANFKFFNDNNDSIYVNITDYLSFDDTSSDYCYVLLELNYENDLFIAGKYVLNNYYSIFDIDNNQLKMYLTKRSDAFDEKDMIILIFTLCIGGLLLLICFCFYKQSNSRNQDDELNINEDLIQENGEERREDVYENEENNELQNNLNDNQNINPQNIDNNDIIRENDENIVINGNNEIDKNEQNESGIVIDNNNTDIN